MNVRTFIRQFLKSASRKDENALFSVKKLQCEITNRCNLACSICYRGLSGKPAGADDIDFKRFNDLFDKLNFFCDIREVNLQGLGEPLLCPDILKIIRYIKSKGISVWFVSNGTLIDKKTADELIESGVDNIRISVDTLDEVLYERVRGTDINRVLSGISHLDAAKKKKGKNTRLSVNTVVFKENISHLEILLRGLAIRGVDEMTLLSLVSFQKGLATEEMQVDFYSDEFRDYFGKLLATAKEVGIELTLGVSMETKGERFCETGLYIDAKGGIFPCCNIGSFRYGHIQDDSVLKIADRYRRFIRQVKAKNVFCRECNRFIDKR